LNNAVGLSRRDLSSSRYHSLAFPAHTVTYIPPSNTITIPATRRTARSQWTRLLFLLHIAPRHLPSQWEREARTKPRTLISQFNRSTPTPGRTSWSLPFLPLTCCQRAVNDGCLTNGLLSSAELDEQYTTGEVIPCF
jgi:hypothetical protein